MDQPTGWRVGTILYWMVALFLTLFGLLALLSIGAPFLLLGVAMIAVSPFRNRPRIFWPVLVGAFALCATFLLTAPLECERTGSLTSEGVEEAEEATCSSLVGIDYSGAGDYEPSLLPALLIGLGVGGAAAVVTRLAVGRGSPPPPSDSL